MNGSPSDTVFDGSIPGVYDRFMVPLLFRPYAEEMARRAHALGATDVLETAAGTGVVTEALHQALPDAAITATDLNSPMLEVARRRVGSPQVRFEQANAQELHFADASFDLVVCQFGVMFFPDKVKGGTEARRVLRDGGHYLLAVWDRIDRNILSNIANESMRELFPDNPPQFMTRGPFSYYDPEVIEGDLRAAGFNDIEIDTITLDSRGATAEDGARGLVYGSPMGVELAMDDYGPDALDRVYETVLKAMREYEGPEGFGAPMTAHIVTAAR